MKSGTQLVEFGFVAKIEFEILYFGFQIFTAMGVKIVGFENVDLNMEVAGLSETLVPIY
jgi:hypothetical protein